MLNSSIIHLMRCFCMVRLGMGQPRLDPTFHSVQLRYYATPNWIWSRCVGPCQPERSFRPVLLRPDIVFVCCSTDGRCLLPLHGLPSRHRRTGRRIRGFRRGSRDMDAGRRTDGLDQCRRQAQFLPALRFTAYRSIRLFARHGICPPGYPRSGERAFAAAPCPSREQARLVVYQRRARAS